MTSGKSILLVLIAFFPKIAIAQVDSLESSPHKFEFDGQASVLSSFSPQNELNVFIGGRYLPELNYSYTFRNSVILDFEASANLYSSILFHPFDSSSYNEDINPYRLWTRITGKQYEVRLGLQKIDFGNATMLRSLQWFDEIDPRDPMRFTRGVYGGLGRYYFLNNVNIWAWVLYGNENPRGFEILKNNKTKPEYGGRVQVPVPRGELAGTFHHRTANSEDLIGFPSYNTIPENRYALDGKWDVGVGLWFEAAYIKKNKNVGLFTHQTNLTLGTDYTFGIGSGLGVTFEHLYISYDEKPFEMQNHANISASLISYPLGFFDRLSTLLYYSHESEDFSFFFNYEHQFKKITGYLMAYYNPETQSGLGTQVENSFSGPGVRIMLLYNH